MEPGHYKMEIQGENVEAIQVDGTIEGTLDETNSIQLDPNTTTIIFEPVDCAPIIVSKAERFETPKPATNKKTRRYSEDLFLKFGFIPSPTNPDLPLCLICERVYSNESMKTPRLREHITKIHPEKAGYDVSYFRALKEQFYITRKISDDNRPNENSYVARKRFVKTGSKQLLFLIHFFSFFFFFVLLPP